MCDLCEHNKKILPTLYGEGIKTMGLMLGMMFGADRDEPCDGIRIINGNMLMWDNSDGEYAELGTKIKFCPICGRPLKAKAN